MVSLKNIVRPISIFCAFGIIVMSRIYSVLFRVPEGAVMPGALTEAGVQVLGIFLAVLLLWLTVAIDWPSLLCLGALMLVPGIAVKDVFINSFGNATFAFLMFTFLCTYALSQTPFIRRCALFFITNRFARKSPWVFAALFFASVLFIGSFISPTVLFVVYLPLLEEIFALYGLKKGDSAASMLMVGLVICCGVSSGMTPIAHIFSIMAMGFYNTATGLNIGYMQFMAFAIPVGLLTAAFMFILMRFAMKPDMSAFKAEKQFEKPAPMDAKEVAVLAVFACVVLLWVAPSLISFALPKTAAFIDKFGTAMPPLLGAVALCIITYKGKPLLNFGEGMAKGVPWGALIMAASTLALGAALTNPTIGLTAALSNTLAPVLSALSPAAVVFAFLLWAAAQTNFSSNMVTVTVVTAVAIPACLALGAAVNTAAVCAFIGILASYAFAFPPAMPCVAIAGSSGWTTAGKLAVYGSAVALAAVFICFFVGYPIAVRVL